MGSALLAFCRLFFFVGLVVGGKQLAVHVGVRFAIQEMRKQFRFFSLNPRTGRKFGSKGAIRRGWISNLCRRQTGLSRCPGIASKIPGGASEQRSSLRWGSNGWNG